MKIWIDKDGNEIAKPVSSITAGATDVQLEAETGCRLIDAPDNRELWGTFDGTRIPYLTEAEYDAKVAAMSAQEAEREKQAQADREAAYAVAMTAHKPNLVAFAEQQYRSLWAAFYGADDVGYRTATREQVAVEVAQKCAANPSLFAITYPFERSFDILPFPL